MPLLQYAKPSPAWHGMKAERFTDAPEQTLAAMQGARLTRRSAVKLGAAAAVAASAFAERFTSGAAAESCESQYPRDQDIVVFDFGPVECDPRIAQDVHVSNGRMLTNMAINGFLEPEERLPFILLATALDSVGNGGAVRERVLEKVPQLAPMADFLTEKQGHGQIVVRVMGDVLEAKGYEATAFPLYPLQDLYEYVRYEDDESGSRTLYAGMGRERFENALSRHPEKIVNLSWQVRELGMRIAKDGVEILGAYRKETALESLTDLAMICNAYPDKLFVVAAGNHNDDLREAIQRLFEQGQLPKNWIIVGEWFPGKWEENDQGLWLPKLNARGADLYVPTKNQKYNKANEGGSTVSTARISAESKIELRSGHDAPSDIRAAIFSRCDIVRHDEPVGTNAFGETIYEKTTTKVFNPVV